MSERQRTDIADLLLNLWERNSRLARKLKRLSCELRLASNSAQHSSGMPQDELDREKERNMHRRDGYKPQADLCALDCPTNVQKNTSTATAAGDSTGGPTTGREENAEDACVSTPCASHRDEARDLSGRNESW